MSTQITPPLRCIRIGNSTINLQNIAFAHILRAKDEELNEVFILRIHFTHGSKLELEHKTQNRCEATRNFLEHAMNDYNPLRDSYSEEHIYNQKVQASEEAHV